jgi:hypothetical protein
VANSRPLYVEIEGWVYRLNPDGSLLPLFPGESVPAGVSVIALTLADLPVDESGNLLFEHAGAEFTIAPTALAALLPEPIGTDIEPGNVGQSSFVGALFAIDYGRPEAIATSGFQSRGIDEPPEPVRQEDQAYVFPPSATKPSVRTSEAVANSTFISIVIASLTRA